MKWLFRCFGCFTDNLLTECPPWTNSMQNRAHTKARCCVGCRADSIFLIRAGQGHLVVLVRVSCVHCPCGRFRTPGRARTLARLRCNQSKYSCSSRHPGSRPSGRHPPPPPPDPSAVPPPSRSSRCFARWRWPPLLPLRGLPPFFLGGASGGPSPPPP